MSHRVLVLGMSPFDSGKTEMSIRLAKFLQQEGHTVEYFKPASGSNYWYKYDHIRHCVRTGHLISVDATRARKQLGSHVSPLMTNPVHSLFVPSRLTRPIRPYPNTLGLAGWDSFLVLQRFSRPAGGVVQSTMLVADALIDNSTVIIPREEVDALTQFARTISVNSLEEAQAYERDLYEDSVTASFAVVEKHADVVVIESFNNSAWPWDGLDQVDVVLVVGPGQAFTYDPWKFRRAVEFTRRGKEPIGQVTVGRVVDLVSPLRRLELRPGIGLGEEEIGILVECIEERVISKKYAEIESKAGRMTT